LKKINEEDPEYRPPTSAINEAMSLAKAKIAELRKMRDAIVEKYK
jgi:hypothetical protein